MTLMDFAFAIVGVVTGITVFVGAWYAVAPLRAEPHQPGQWLSVMFAGLAAIAVAIAGIVVAERGEGFSGTGDYALLTGAAIVGITGLVLVISAIAIYEPDHAAPDQG